MKMTKRDLPQLLHVNRILGCVGQARPESAKHRGRCVASVCLQGVGMDVDVGDG